MSILGKTRGFKSLIATSLVVALGISVAYAKSNQVITQDANLTTDQTINSANLIVEESAKSGLKFIMKKDKQSLTLNGNLTVEMIDGGATHRAYGIFIDKANSKDLTIKSSSNKYLLIKGVLSSKESYIFANESDKKVIFNNVSLIANPITPHSSNTLFGVYNGLEGSNYNFGSNTGQTIFTLTGNTQQANVVGIVLAKSANFTGNLELSATGGMGGKAIALKSMENTTLNLSSENMTLSLNAKGGSTDNNRSMIGDGIGIETTGDFLIIQNKKNNKLGNKLLVMASGNKAYGIRLTGKNSSVNLGQISFIGSNSSSAIQGIQEAYGIYNLGSNTLSGTFIFGDGTNSAISTDSTKNSYILYNANEANLIFNGTLDIKSNALKETDAKNAYALYNAGNLTLGNDAKIQIGEYNGNAIIGAKLDNKSINLELGDLKINTQEKKDIFEAKGDVTFNLSLAQGKTAILYGNDTFKTTRDGQHSGTINLKLGDSSILAFDSNGGSLNTLSGQNASILLAGSSQDEVDKRLTLKSNGKSTFTARQLSTSDFQLNNSSILLAISHKKFLEEEGSPTYSTASSDRLIISGSSSMDSKPRVLNNSLHIVIDEYAQGGADKQVLLAFVSNSNTKNTLIFNGLKASGDKAESTVYHGFATGVITIERTDLDEKFQPITSQEQGKYTSYHSNLKLGTMKINSSFVNPTAAALSTGLSLLSANLNNLNKRMGDLRDNPYSQGAWGRVFGGEQTTEFGSKQDTVYFTVQSGYDYKFGLDNAGNYLGFALSYTKGMGGQVDPAYQTNPIPNTIPIIAGISSSKTDGLELAIYNSYVADSGIYSDTIAKLGYYMHQITMPLQSNAHKTNNLSATISQELGYRIKLGEHKSWFIDPQAEVSFSYIEGDELTQTFSSFFLRAAQDTTYLLRSRVGSAFGYQFDHPMKEKAMRASLYVGAYYTYDYFIGGDTTLSTLVAKKEVSHTYNAFEGTGRFVMNLGTNLEIRESTRMYFNFEKSFGGKIQTDYQVSLGFRFAFGEKNSPSIDNQPQNF